MPKTRKGTDWRDLSRSKSGGRRKPLPTSWRAKLRTAAVWGKRVLVAAVFCAAVWGIVAAYGNFSLRKALVGKSQRITNIELSTNGYIKGKWLTSYLTVAPEERMDTLNIFFIKDSLEALSQVKNAKVEKIYPSTVRITLDERKAVARLGGNTNRKYLVGEDGELYSPICVPDAEIDALPTAVWNFPYPATVGIKFKHVDTLKAFLAAAKKAGMLGDFESVDTLMLDSITLPLIRVKSKAYNEIVFSDKNIARQFDRLGYILRYLKENAIENVESIDVSLDDPAVKIKGAQKK